MKRTFTAEQTKAAIFKGLYIDEFLRIEYYIEDIIVSFFSEKLSTHKFAIHQFFATDTKEDVETRNEHKEYFLKYSLFPDGQFTFKQKLNGLTTIMQLTNRDFFNAVNKHEPHNIFDLIKYLSEFRNVVAHNITGYENDEIVGFKVGGGYKIVAGQGKNKKDENITIEEKRYIPVIKIFKISEKIEDEIFEQLIAARAFVYLYLTKSPDLNYKDFSEEEYDKYIDNLRGLYFNKIWEYNYGIFRFFTKKPPTKEQIRKAKVEKTKKG